MYELSSHIAHWFDQNKLVCLATVISTWGSSPRPPGAKMAFTPDPLISGSVSGGCVEGAVIDAGINVIKAGKAVRLHYGVTDEIAVNVGLACGGEIDIVVRQLDSTLFQALRNLMQTHTTAYLLTIVEPDSRLLGCDMLVEESGQVVFSNLGGIIDQTILADQLKFNEIKLSQTTVLEAPGQGLLHVFIDVINPPPVLVIVGGVHIAISLAALAKNLGFQTVVIDPRKAFATPERFPQVDRIIQAWPDEAFQKVIISANTNIAILTHDPKIDDPALKIVLNSPAQYIGVLGSPATHEKRRKRLLAEGISEGQLVRLHAPIGLDLGGKTPQEIALGILAEIIAARHGLNFKV